MVLHRRVDTKGAAKKSGSLKRMIPTKLILPLTAEHRCRTPIKIRRDGEAVSVVFLFKAKTSDLVRATI